MSQKSSSLQLDLQVVCQHSGTPSKAQFMRWLQQALQNKRLLKENSLSTTLELCIRLVDQDEMQQLNHQFRQQDKATNVLAFPFEPLPGWFVDQQVLGDIVICTPVVFAEAEQQNKVALNHWAHLTLHGFLHLLGYDHIEEIDADKMESLEIDLLAELNLPNPYLTSTTLLHS